MKSGTWERHCSNCAAYRISDRAGVGTCSTWRKDVSWSLVCVEWRQRG